MPLKTNTPEQREAYKLYMREYQKRRYQNDEEHKRKQLERVKARQARKKLELEMFEQMEINRDAIMEDVDRDLADAVREIQHYEDIEKDDFY